MKCHSYELQVSELIDGELPSEKMSALFVHLGGCPNCQSFLSSVIRLREELHAGSPATSQRTSESRVVPRAEWFLRKRFLVSIPAAALVLLTLIVSSWYVSSKITQQSVKTKSPDVVYIMSLPYIEVKPSSQVHH